MIGDIANKTPDTDVEKILEAIGSDSRVGLKCLKYGYGFGGPCFPRDNRALGTYAKMVGIKPFICESTDNYNKEHCLIMVDELLYKNLDTYVIQDVVYKPKCLVDIIEESQPLEIAKNLVKHGKKVIIRDRKSVINIVLQKYGNMFEYEVN